MQGEAYVTARYDQRHCSTTLPTRRTWLRKVGDCDSCVTMRDESVAADRTLVLTRTQEPEIARTDRTRDIRRASVYRHTRCDYIAVEGIPS